MKKLALVLGSLLVVGSVASAKEVMPAPTPAPEKVVEYVEKPVIVYRDREVAPAWRPNGSVDLQYRWYGEIENKNPKEERNGTPWTEGQKVNASRLQTRVILNFTEKQTLDVRMKNYQTLNDTDANNLKSQGAADEYRLRHFYNFGKLGSSKINATSRLEYKQKGNDGKKAAAASVFFDFADYIYSNNFFKADKFGFRPEYRYVWIGHGKTDADSQYRNEAHLAFESDFTLPFNFALNLGYDFAYHRYPVKIKRAVEDKKGEWYGELTAVLSNYTPLYKSGAFELGFNAEGGYSTYNMHQYKRAGGTGTGGYDGTSVGRRDYELYLEPTLQVSYKPTDFVKLYAAAGADYRNRTTNESEVKNWRWQPTAWAGMKVTF